MRNRWEYQIGPVLLLIPFAVFLIAIGLSVTRQTPYTAIAVVKDGDPQQGPAEMVRYGCGACHVIQGVPQAEGKVGPPLSGLAARGYIAGRLPFSADNLVYWIQKPQEASPGTDMPDLGVTDSAARDMAAYLLTLK